MEIATTETDWLIEAEEIVRQAANFITPENITKADISNIGWVDTIQFDGQLYCFTSNKHTYLLFDDECSLTNELVRNRLEACSAIKEPKGYLCEAVDKTDDIYGVSEDHDPFHDGYTYLWCCSSEGTRGES
jgi:hypothetical protein